MTNEWSNYNPRWQNGTLVADTREWEMLGGEGAIKLRDLRNRARWKTHAGCRPWFPRNFSAFREDARENIDRGVWCRSPPKKHGKRIWKASFQENKKIPNINSNWEIKNKVKNTWNLIGIFPEEWPLEVNICIHTHVYVRPTFFRGKGWVQKKKIFWTMNNSSKLMEVVNSMCLLWSRHLRIQAGTWSVSSPGAAVLSTTVAAKALCGI